MTSKIVKICTWNVNSIAIRAEQLVAIIEEHQPDFLLLQEIKCVTEKFPQHFFDGYKCLINGQKAFNGVAILARNEYDILDIKTKFYDDLEDARYIEIQVKIFNKILNIASVYAPQGQEIGSEKFLYKLRFLSELHKYLKERKNIIIAGDYNVAPYDIDILNPMDNRGRICFSIEEKRKFRALYNIGIYDACRLYNASDNNFTWWGYMNSGFQKNDGMRIDNILLDYHIARFFHKYFVEIKYRQMEKPSDHIPIFAEFVFFEN